MGDSFAESMRKRALERLERNARIIQSNDVSTDFDYPTLSKKPKNTDNTVRREDKESFNDNAIIISNTAKPVIAEHLTVRKSVDIMECDDPEAFVMRTRRKPLFPAEYCDVGKLDDVYVKHCKNRLGNLAYKFKTFEEEDKSVPLRTSGKQDTTKRRSVSNLAVVSERKTVKSVSRNSPRREMSESASKYIAPSPKTRSESMKNENLPAGKNMSEKIVLAETVINTLESQGFSKTDSDTRMMYDFQASKKNFNKENAIVNAIPKLQRKFEVARRNAENLESKEISNIYSNSKFQNNVFVQNSKKVNQEDTSVQDPCLLSVAERRKLFERRLAGEIEKPLILDTTDSANTGSVRNVDLSESADEEYNSGNEYSTCENESNEYSDFEAVTSSHTTTSEEVIRFGHENNESDVEEDDLSGYPVLQSVNKVKFMSTPKPGRLYPSDSDVGGEIEDDYNVTKLEASGRTPNEDDSFGKEVLCATNSIFSSFRNSRKKVDENEKSKTDILTEVKDLISPGNDKSFSVSPLARSSTASVESELAEEHKFISQVVVVESDVKKKIRFLEELIVKEKIILTQEIRALKYCLSTSFMNSSSHLEAEKLVLLSQLKIGAAQNEIQRIKVENTVKSLLAHNSVSGNVVISKIRLPIKTSMIHDNLKDDIENNLLCIIKCGDLVMASEVVPVVQRRTKQDIDGTYIEFPDTITVSDVNSDFNIRIEIYNLIIDKRDLALIKRKDKDKKNQGSKHSKKKGIFSLYEDVNKNAHPSSFVMIGYVVFSQNVSKKHQWMLNKHHLPLVGMIMMELKFNLSKITVQKHGFLTMYEIISGYGAWSRYWFYLNGDKLSFWKYPEQENVQDPIGTFDLKRCITKDIVVVGYDVVFRPHTFILKFDSPNYLRQFKNLTEDRLLLSADTEEERIAWCSCFNDVLKSVRSWSNLIE